MFAIKEENHQLRPERIKGIPNLLRKAAGEVWPKTREQRCWVHKTAECPPLSQEG